MSTGFSTNRSTTATLSKSREVSFGARVADYIELTKPRIALLAILTVTIGFVLAATESVSLPLLGHALFGIACVAGASSALNQLFEINSDANMYRTANRPLPAGRLTSLEVVCFGVATGVGGIWWLAAFVNMTTAFLAAGTLVLYAFIYTPLKRKTSLCTAIGAIPGAMPPVLGWTAAGGEIDSAAFTLFGILFLWQFPHFLAIAWLYQEQYANAGLQMLPIRQHCDDSESGGLPIVGLLSVLYVLVLIPVSLLPSQIGLAGQAYFLAAVVLGLGYLICAIRFLLNETRETARGLLWSSLLYLPALLVAMLWDHLQLLGYGWQT